MIRDITKHKQAEKALQEERDHLRRLLDMQERDRKLVAYEIHDGLVQLLVGARMFLEGAEQAVQSRHPEDDRQDYQRGLRLLSDAIDQARVLISGQRPLVLDERGLLAAIEYLACDVPEYGKTDVEFMHDVDFDRLAPPLENAVFRIAQESLTNARRHSQSERVQIGLVQREGRLQLEVEDWGIGFDPETVAPNSFGLEGIRERARLFGGSATIDSAPGRGTRIIVNLPLVEE